MNNGTGMCTLDAVEHCHRVTPIPHYCSMSLIYTKFNAKEYA